MKSIIIITGASGVGKTTLVNSLKSTLNKNDFQFLKFNGIGVPSFEEMIEKHGSPAKWQEIKTYEWIEKLVNNLGERKIIFEGQMNLDFIINGFKRHHFDDYKIVLIDCSEEVMINRLIEERKQPELANEDMCNWLRFLRNQAKKYSVAIIDTTNLDKEETATKFINEVSASST